MEHWDAANGGRKDIGNGNIEWESNGRVSLRRGGGSGGESWELRKGKNAFPRLDRNDSFASIVSDISSIAPSPRPRKKDSWRSDRPSQRRNDSWDTVGSSSRSQRQTRNRQDDHDQNEAGWEKEERDEENERMWADEERREENERNWAIEEKIDENERNWAAEMKREENDRLWNEARQEHTLRSVTSQTPPAPIRKAQILQRPRSERAIVVEPTKQEQIQRKPVIAENRSVINSRYTTTTAMQTGEDLAPSPLRISRTESWRSSSQTQVSQSVPISLRARGARTESWHDANNINIRTASVTMRGGGRDDVSLDLETPRSGIDEGTSSDGSAQDARQAENQDVQRSVASPARLVFQFKPQRPQRTGSLTPPCSSFAISPMSFTQVGSENGSLANLNDFNSQNSQISVVSIIKYTDKDIQCDFDAPPPPPPKRGFFAGLGPGKPTDGGLPTGGRLAILLVCTCMAVFLQALVIFQFEVVLEHC